MGGIAQREETAPLRAVRSALEPSLHGVPSSFDGGIGASPSSAPPTLNRRRSTPRNVTSHTRRRSVGAVSSPAFNQSHFKKKVEIPPGVAATATRFEPIELTGIDHNRPRTASAPDTTTFDDDAVTTPRKEPSKSGNGLKHKITKVVRAARIPPPRHRKRVRDGQVVFKGHPSWEIVLSIQFGLRYTSELLQSSEDDSEPTDADFRESLAFDFNPVDDYRAAVDTNHFAKWVHPAPFVYQQIRKKFDVDEELFLEATCSESRIRELPTPGKSGALFYITDDEKYFMKTITGNEERMLMAMLPSYYAHISKYPRTFLTRYLAHFSVRTTRNNHIRMVVMASIFDEQLFIDKKFDLKGSSYKRFASPKQRESKNVTFKDLDMKGPIFFSASAFERIHNQLAEDADFLEFHRVMDYSLLLGISEMLQDEDEYYKDAFGMEEEEAPYEVGYQLDADGQKIGVRVCMGIIDFLQRFRTRKKAEYGMRVVQSCSCSAASVAPPSLYKRRFLHFLKEKLKSDPKFDLNTLVQGSADSGSYPNSGKELPPGAPDNTPQEQDNLSQAQSDESEAKKLEEMQLELEELGLPAYEDYRYHGKQQLLQESNVQLKP